MAERLVELGAGFDGEREGRRVGGRDTGGGGGFSVGVVAEKLLSEALERTLCNYQTPSLLYLR